MNFSKRLQIKRVRVLRLLNLAITFAMVVSLLPFGLAGHGLQSASAAPDFSQATSAQSHAPLAALAPAGDPPVQTYYVPFPEQQVFDALTDIAEDSTATDHVNGDVHSVVSIVGGFDGTVVYYDHWEDGYEADIANPVQATTEVWGDGATGNGDVNIPLYGGAVGCATGCTGDTFNKGDVISLENDIPLPRISANFFYDGRDKIGVTRAVAVTRASWVENPAALLAGAVEVYSSSAYDTSFEIPVGENTGSSTSPGISAPYKITAPQIFEYVSLFIQASENGTTVSIDKDGDGTDDIINQPLAEGEVYWLPGNTGGMPGAYVGATVTSNKPVQVDVITGNKSYEQKIQATPPGTTFNPAYVVDSVAERYDARWFSLFPTADWADSYYSPVGKNDAIDKVHVYLYNPAGSAITVNYQTLTGSGSFSVPGGGLKEFTMPSNSGAHFWSTGNDFYAISTIDTDGDGSGTDGTTTTHDWGFPLVPETSLTNIARVGWAPGSQDLSANYSPVWVTSIADTRIYIDLDGDGVGPLTDPLGNQYDEHRDISTLESVLIYHDADNDQTGMNIYTVDGTLITATYGQDPGTAVGGFPAIDVGTTVLPFPQVLVRKSASLAEDNVPVGGNGEYDPGDIIEWTITVDNRGETPLLNVVVSDTITADTTYVNSSTYTDTVNLVADNTLPATLFPLDEGGITLDSVALGAVSTVSYRALINIDWPLDKTSLTNIATVVTSIGEFYPEAKVPVNPPNNDACTASFIDGLLGDPALFYAENGTLYVRLADSDANTTAGVDSASAIVTNLSNGDVETVSLSETGGLSGIFEGSIASSTGAGMSGDGTMNAAAVDTLEVSYQDPTYPFDVCDDTIQLDPPLKVKPLYLTEPQHLDRVDPAGSGDVSTSQSITVTGGLNPPLYVCYASETVYATQATWILEESDGNDNQDGSNLEVKDDTNEPKDRNALVQFDLPTLPASAEIKSATLGMHVQAEKATLSVLVKRLTASWDETTVTWNTKPASTGSYGFFVPDPKDVYIDHDVTSLVSGWVDGSFSNHGIVLEGNSENDGDTAKFFDEDEPGKQPRLTIGYEYTYPGGCLQTTRIRVSDGDGDDGWIDQNSPANNEGDNSRLFIDSRAATLAHSMVKFDMSAIPAGSTVTNATFGINLQTAKASTSNIYELTTAWVEGDGTAGSGASWSDPDGTGGLNGWDNAGGDFASGVFYDSANLLGTINNNQSTGVFYTIDETDATGARDLADVVEDWVAGTNNGLLLLATGTQDGDAKYYSKEEGNTALEPYIDVTYVSPTGTLTLIANQDAFIDEDKPTENFNTTEMKVKNDVGGTQNRSILVEFDLSSGLPTGAKITGATFNIYVTSENTDQTVTIRALENNWKENETTYNERLTGTAWDTAGGDYSGNYGTFTPTPQDAYVSVNIDALAQGWDAGTIDNFGVILDPSSAADTESKYSSREVEDEEPYLTVTYDAAILATSTTIAYTQTLAMASDLAVPAGQTMTVTNWVDMTPGKTLSGTLDITATLKHDGTTFATLSNPTVNPTPCTDANDPCTLTWTGVVAANSIIPEGEQIILEHSNSEDNSSYKILFDSATYPSRILLPTYDVIDVYNVRAYDAAYSGGVQTTTVAVGDTVYLRGTVVDPFDASDIISATLTITDTGGTPTSVTPPVVNTTYGSKTYEYAWTAPTAECGVFPFSLTVWEGYEGITDTASGSIEVTGCAELKIDKDTSTPIVVAGEEAVYTIVISNTGGLATGVTISDTLPVSFTYASTSAIDTSGAVTRTSTLNPTAAATTPTWGAWDMAANSAITLTFLADVDAAITLGTYDNDAFADAANHALIDDVGTQAGDADTLPTDTPETDEDVRVISSLGAIGDYVWYDASDDGIQDVNEPGIANVVMELWQDADMDGAYSPITDTLVATATTDADGGYLFADVLPGDYFVRADETSASLGGLSLTAGPQSQTNPSAPITIDDGDTFRDADFGYILDPGAGAVIGDKVFYDANGNGIHDAGELGIPGVTVIITDSVGATYTAITNANGVYRKIVTVDGVLTCTVAPDPASLALAGLSPTSPTPHLVPALDPGDQYLDADFGYNGSGLGNIDGLVFNDVDNNGFYNPFSEAIIAGVSVQLFRDANGNGVLDGNDPIVATQVTDGIADANGNNYSFDGLPADTYFVQVSDTQNVLKRFEPAALGTPDADNNSQAQPYKVTLGSGAGVLTADFGYISGGPGGSGDPTGIIGNQIWHDLDGDGVYEPGNGETGIAGVTVELRTSGGFLLMTTTTGASGNYMFLDVPAGDYVVQVSDDANVLDGYVPVIGPNPGADNNGQAQPYALTLPAGGFNFTADFAYAQPVTIGDFVYYDPNGNGAQDLPAEAAGINSVQITMTNLGTGAIYTTATDSNGVYTFTVPPGTYEVFAPDALPGLVRTSPSPQAITLLSGQSTDTLDFGYIAPTAVTLASFTAEDNGGAITIYWSTSTEVEQEGFVVWRALAAEGPYKPVSDLILASNDPAGSHYKWLDSTIDPTASPWYKLESRPDGEFFGPIPGRDDPGDGAVRLFTPLILR